MADSPLKTDPPPLPVRRVALLVEYDGSAFRGLQAQAPPARTIQGEVEAALRTIGARDPGFIASGRTDAGVHATGQVIAANVPVRMEEGAVAKSLNALLPPDIRVRAARDCGGDFSPRFDAIRRHYVYRLCSREPVTPILRHCVAHTSRAMDAARVHAAAEAFHGKWELREWRSSSCQATRTALTIESVRVYPPGGDGPGALIGGGRLYWEIHVSSRSFLHHQVRFMVGALTAVGSGKLTVEELREALATGRRPAIVKVEPARGLTLARVEFKPGRDPFV